MSSPVQFVIWGKPPAAKYEGLLVSEHAGIASVEQAKAVIAKLEKEHGCSECRYQQLQPLHELNVQELFAKSVAL